MTSDANQQLLQAAEGGDLSGVIQALSDGADVNARGMFGDTALNQAAERGHLDIVEHLLEAGADLHNVGGADKTPIMNAAFAGHVEIVRLLLEKGARVNNDLLSSVQLKVNILKENAEGGMVNPAAVDAWKGFLRFLVTAKIRQDLPEIIEGLSAENPETRKAALDRIESAAIRGIDIADALTRVTELVSDPDAETRRTASAALSIRYVQDQDWDRLRHLVETGDQAVKTGAISEMVAAARDGLDVSSLVSTVVNILGEDSLDLRHDAAITLGYAATNHIDVSGAIPQLTKLLSDSEPDARKMAAWALYRIAKYIGSIAEAVPALQALVSDEDEGARDMAIDALKMAEERQQ